MRRDRTGGFVAFIYCCLAWATHSASFLVGPAAHRRVAIGKGRHHAGHARTAPRRPQLARLRALIDVEPAEVVEAGCILIANPEDFGHFTMKSVALVYEHNTAGSKAVCLDRGTPFTIGEMASADFGALTDNRLYRGGEDGGSAALVIHPYSIDGSKPVGNTGLSVGGIRAASELASSGLAPKEHFKFFFNYMSWPVGGIEEQVAKGKWQLARLPNDIILNQASDWDLELWGKVRNAVIALGLQ